MLSNKWLLCDFFLKLVSSPSFSFLFFDKILHLTVRIVVFGLLHIPLKILLDWNARSLSCRRSRRARLELHWNLAVVLYCQNICAKIISDVKIAPYSQRPMFVQCEGKFLLRIKQFKA